MVVSQVGRHQQAVLPDNSGIDKPALIELAANREWMRLVAEFQARKAESIQLLVHNYDLTLVERVKYQAQIAVMEEVIGLVETRLHKQLKQTTRQFNERSR